MFAIHMDYSTKPDCFEFFVDYYKEHEIKFLVGFTMPAFEEIVAWALPTVIKSYGNKL